MYVEFTSKQLHEYNKIVANIDGCENPNDIIPINNTASTIRLIIDFLSNHPITYFFLFFFNSFAKPTISILSPR